METDRSDKAILRLQELLSLNVRYNRHLVCHNVVVREASIGSVDILIKISLFLL